MSRVINSRMFICVHAPKNIHLLVDCYRHLKIIAVKYFENFVYSVSDHGDDPGMRVFAVFLGFSEPKIKYFFEWALGLTGGLNEISLAKDMFYPH